MFQKEIHLKAVLFDMDGVLFNSMPYHAEAWHKVMLAHGLNLSLFTRRAYRSRYYQHCKPTPIRTGSNARRDREHLPREE